MVAWLASTDCDVTGRVLEIDGGRICLETAWRHGPVRDAGRRWAAEEVGAAVRGMVAEAPVPEAVYGAG